MYSYFNSWDKLLSNPSNKEQSSVVSKSTHFTYKDKFASNDKENIEVNNMKVSWNMQNEEPVKKILTQKAEDEDQIEVKSTAHQLYVNHFWNFTIIQAELEE